MFQTEACDQEYRRKSLSKPSSPNHTVTLQEQAPRAT